MIIYHGGDIAIEKPEIRIGKYTKDFGNGFYCTEIKEQVIKWAKRYKTPVVSIFEYENNNSLNSKNFEEMTDEWLDFIVDCRNKVEYNYDIVIGAMANDQIYNYIADFISGTITREQFWALSKFKYPTHQINFCSEQALQCLTYKGYEEVTI